MNLPDPPNTCYLLFPGKEGGGVRVGEREKEKGTLTRILEIW